MSDTDELLRHLDGLPDGVQAEVRNAVRACLDVVGPGVVRMLEIAAEHGLLDEVTGSAEVAPLLALCGLEPESRTPVALAPRPGCELCGVPIGSSHHHGADVADRRLVCVCGACAITLHGQGRFQSLPDRAEMVVAAEVAPPWWEELDLPVELAFVLRSTVTDGFVLAYPGTAGVIESELGPVSLPIDLRDDVEALLVRHRPRFEAWRVPVDRCYELAGLLRHRPPAATGELIDVFFGRLADR